MRDFWQARPWRRLIVVHYRLQDGTRITLWSVSQKMFLSAAGGGGSAVTADQSKAQDWEIFRLWKMDSSGHMFKIRSNKNQFISINDGEQLVATATSHSQAGEFQFIINKKNREKIRIRAPNGKFLQVEQSGSVTANSEASGSWSDKDPSVFKIQVTGQMQGDTQLCSFYGAEQAVSMLQDHWSTFIVEDDFSFISSNGLNAVRIPVAWWITNEANTPSCHPPSYPRYQAVLDKAFDWADKYNLGVIVDLHAAPWSQNGHEHSGSRDGTVGWGTSDGNIDQTVQVIEALAARYASRKSLLAIELLNEPSIEVQFDALKKYYKAGYEAVHRHVQRDDVYVIMSGRLIQNGATEMVDFASRFKKCVLDVHYYNLYDPKYESMSAGQNIDYVKTVRANHLNTLMRQNGALVFVGECRWADGLVLFTILLHIFTSYDISYQATQENMELDICNYPYHYYESSRILPNIKFKGV
ncbi:hypothetical protein SETIT_9G269700v2 [Setaria italica]|uniref:Uncharacterized protein n=1 Tax=Setaria italica TaxID=4555 RepID=A0A368SMU4_SETIT|nr:hypothetical protein SETIT_9G269700v2 [Setaria italica]